MSSPGTDDTHHLSRGPSTTDQLAAIAYFLDELEAKTPVKHLQRETDGNKALLDTINALIAVGAFIAGVQAQIIGIANPSTVSVLARTTNWFAFVGLTLDLIGTSSGVARALLLQAAIRRMHRLSAGLTGQIDGARQQLRELQQSGMDLSSNAQARAFLGRSVRAMSHIMALLAEDGRFGVQVVEQITEIEAAGVAALDALGSRPRLRWGWRDRARHAFRALVLWDVVRLNAHVEGLGHIPVLSLAGGSLCLLTSVVLVAAASQERGVWISCTAIAVCMFVGSVTPTTDARKRKRATLYDRVEETLQECPPVEPPVYSATKERDPGS